MSSEELDMRKRIYRLEDNLLRCKNFNEQIRMRNVLSGYRKELQNIVFKQRELFG